MYLCTAGWEVDAKWGVLFKEGGPLVKLKEVKDRGYERGKGVFYVLE